MISNPGKQVYSIIIEQRQQHDQTNLDFDKNTERTVGQMPQGFCPKIVPEIGD